MTFRKQQPSPLARRTLRLAVRDCLAPGQLGHSAISLLGAGLLGLAASANASADFPAAIDPASLDGSTGFVINGANPKGKAGYSVSNAGDINGDGFDDLIIGAPMAGRLSECITYWHCSANGLSYVVFGGPEVGDSGIVELADLNGDNGFAIAGIGDTDFSGISVSNAGDVNGDGIDDLIIGAPGADPNGQGSGRVYVVFGNPNVGNNGILDLSQLDGNNGFVIHGISAGNGVGQSVSSAGDINGDGVDDLIIGAPTAAEGRGRSYVVFGSPGVGSTGVIELADLNGANGFAINGIRPGDGSGSSVSSAGDINGDGIADLIIGAPWAGELTYSNGYWHGPGSGQAYVVFGSPGIGSSGVIELSDLDGKNGTIINGVQHGDRAGWSVSDAGDINGDGFGDLIIGAPDARVYGGASHVVFGGPKIGSTGVIELAELDGRSGFTVHAIRDYDRSGSSVSSAGDINGDGFADLIVGAPWANPKNYLTYRYRESGQSYVIFGGPDVGKSGVINAGDLIGSNGFVIDGAGDSSASGWSVSTAGDINGDGIDDLIMGAPWADPLTNRSGQSHVIFGRTSSEPPPSTAGITLPRLLSISETPGHSGNRVASVERNNGSTVVRLRAVDDITTGSEIRFGAGLLGLDAAVLPDLAGSPAPELAVLGDNGRVEVRDSLSGELLSELHFDVVPKRLSFVEHTKAPAIAVLGQSSDGGAAVEVRHALSGALLARIDYAAAITPVGLVAVNQGPGQSAIGVLGEHRDPQGRDRIELRDIATGAVLQHLSLGHQFNMRNTLPLIDNDGITQLVTLRSTTTRVNVAVHDPQSASPSSQTGFDPSFTPRALVAMPDIDGNGAPEIGVLGRREDGLQQLLIKDSATKTVLIRTAVERATVVQDAILIPDANYDKVPDIAILGRRANGQMILFIKDGRTGEQLHRVRL